MKPDLRARAKEVLQLLAHLAIHVQMQCAFDG
jgi:hypothetical protein